MERVASGFGGIFVFYIPIIGLLAGLVAMIYFTILPYEVEDVNQSILLPIMGLNLLISIICLLLVYAFQSFSENIIQISIASTFLLALPLTLMNSGITSVLFSN